MRRTEIAVLGAGAVVASVFLSFWPGNVQDYARDAGPSLHPLINGDLTTALVHQPAMGWFSIILRAPFVFFARHGSALLEYRLGAVPCVLAVAALGMWLAMRMRREGRALAVCALVLAIAIFGSMNWHALSDGHPEELLGSALCVGAVFLAASGRAPLVAGLVLGLALATKQWAVLAAGPALLAAPRGRVIIAGTALAVGGALTLLPVLAGPHDLLSPATSISPASSRVQPASIWWPLGQTHHIVAGGWPAEIHTIPQSLANLTHPLIVALGVLLPLVLLALRRHRASLPDGLTLLTLLLLLRCLLDPMTVGYYNAPALISLLALEALSRRDVPVLTVVSNAVMWLLVARVPWGTEPATVAAIYLAWALPLTAYLAARLYAPTVSRRFGKWLSSSLPSSVTTTRSSIRTPNAPGT